MENTQSVKSLKKQLMAAIAMVLVAAIALGSSTYAWFVSNNTVKGTTTNISAQSNAAFMVIDKTVTSENSGTEDSYEGNSKALYPAKVDEIANAVTLGNGDLGQKGYVMQSAFAATGDKSTMKAGTLFDIVGTENGNNITGTAKTGTADAAVQSGFAIKQTFYIGEKTGTTELKNLRVSGINMTTGTTSGTDDLADAMRVLVICGENWIVYDKDKTVQETNIKETNGEHILKTEGFKGVGATNQVTVDMYVYYDGDDQDVYTTNLGNLATDHGLTVSFTADNAAAGGSTGSTGTATSK